MKKLLGRQFDLARDQMRRVSRGAMRDGSYGMADQAISAGVNFIIVIAAARTLGPAAFGLFSLLRTGMLLGVAMQGSLVTTPHNVYGATREGKDYRRYTGTVMILQAGLAILIAAIFLLILLTIEVVSDTVETMMLAMIFAAAAWQFQEFTRGVLYTEQRFAGALLNTVFTYGLRLLALALLLLTIGLSGELLFLLMGATWSVGAIIGFIQIRHSIEFSIDRGVCREHWVFGRWLCASSFVGHLPHYITAAVMTSVIGVSAYGAYRAFSQLMSGVRVPRRAVASVLRPALARSASAGPHTVWSMIRPVMALGGLAFTALAVAMWFLRDEVMGFIFGPEFVPYAAVVFLIVLTPIFAWQWEMLSVALESLKTTRPIFLASTIGTIVGCIVGPLALITFGLPAAGAQGLTITLLTTFLLARVWKRRLTEAHSLDFSSAQRRQTAVEHRP